MKCPKCDHEQTNRIECEACGIFFEKYINRLQEGPDDKKTGKEYLPVPTVTTKANHRSWVIPGGVLVVAFVLSLFFLIKAYTSPENDASELSINISKVNQFGNKATIFPEPNHSATDQDAPEGIREELQKTHPPRNNIEKATLATVFIKTPWSIGSGFFINDSCYIVTNRHVVEFDRDAFATIDQQLQQQKDFIEKEGRRLEDFEYDMYKAKDESYQRRYGPRLEERKKRLDRVKIDYENARSKLDDIEMSADLGQYIVSLVNETELTAQIAEVSEKYDLALLSVNEINCPCLQPDISPAFEQGENVYTIGSPVGLKHTVTSGIVSGLRRYNGDVYIQTDAPINPGNSGGPLIDTNGKIIGVNTLIVKNTEGIGFSIPIKAVFDEFDLEPCQY